MPSFQRPKDQIWMMFMLESPLNTQKFKHPEVFNWTATYRYLGDILLTSKD